MDKETPDRKNSKIIEKLFSANDHEVLTVIREIRVAGNPGLIPPLLKLYEATASRAVFLAVIALVRDLKSQPAVAYLAPAVAGISDPAKKRELVAACWQSGLDFSEHLDVFLKIFSEGDYMTALEAFTVIENSLPYLLEASLLEEHISFIREKMSEGADEKEALYEALLSLMQESLRHLPDQP